MNAETYFPRHAEVGAADELNEARRHIGNALRKHGGATNLDEATRHLLQAVELIDGARKQLQHPPSCPGCDSEQCERGGR